MQKHYRYVIVTGNMKTITAVVPCYNEEKIIQKTINRLKPVVDRIIVVDNGSTDNSASIAKKNGVLVISESRKHKGIGVGYAMITGMNNATTDYIITVDADGEHPIERIPKLVEKAIASGVDFTNCSRTSRDAKHLMASVRSFGTKILNYVAFLLYGFKTQDLLCGMWIVKSSIVPKLNLRQGDWNLVPEIKVSAWTNENISYAELPITATVRQEGSKQVLWRTFSIHFLFLLEFRLELLIKEVRNVFVPPIAKLFSLTVK